MSNDQPAWPPPGLMKKLQEIIASAELEKALKSPLTEVADQLAQQHADALKAMTAPQLDETLKAVTAAFRIDLPELSEPMKKFIAMQEERRATLSAAIEQLRVAPEQAVHVPTIASAVHIPAPTIVTSSDSATFVESASVEELAAAAPSEIDKRAATVLIIAFAFVAASYAVRRTGNDELADTLYGLGVDLLPLGLALFTALRPRK